MPRKPLRVGTPRPKVTGSRKKRSKRRESVGVLMGVTPGRTRGTNLTETAAIRAAEGAAAALDAFALRPSSRTLRKKRREQKKTKGVDKPGAAGVAPSLPSGFEGESPFILNHTRGVEDQIITKTWKTLGGVHSRRSYLRVPSAAPLGGRARLGQDVSPRPGPTRSSMPTLNLYTAKWKAEVQVDRRAKMACARETNYYYYYYCNCRELTSLVFPKTLTDIGTKAFIQCINLTSLTLPDTTTRVGKYAFKRCTRLISITLPSTFAMTNIDKYAFDGYSRLKNVVFRPLASQVFLVWALGMSHNRDA